MNIKQVPNGKSVLLIGQLTQEGVTTKVKSLGYSYCQKILVRTSPKNWFATTELTRELRNSGNLVAVFLHLTEGVLEMSTDKVYSEVWDELLAEMGKSKSLAFIYEENLMGKFAPETLGGTSYTNDYSKWLKSRYSPDGMKAVLEAAHRGGRTHDPAYDEWIDSRGGDARQSLKESLDRVIASGIEIAPYRKRTQLTIRIQEFLEELDTGVLLRLYVPNKRYQGEQLGGFIRLLESYLRSIERSSFSVDVQKTEHGLVYIFRSKDNIDLAQLGQALDRFETFIGLCQNDISSARELLRHADIQQAEAENIIAKYLREYRRLILDIKHEYEQKTLAIEQRLEDEVLDLQGGSRLNIPVPSSPSSLLSLPQNLGTININLSAHSLQQNQIIQSVVTQTLNGDITYGAEDSQLIDLFEKFGDRLEALKLRSLLDELKDESSPQEKRQTAAQKIRGFLFKYAPKVGEAAAKILLEYVGKKIGGTP
jgi:hypothetical protein